MSCIFHSAGYIFTDFIIFSHISQKDKKYSFEYYINGMQITISPLSFSFFFFFFFWGGGGGGGDVPRTCENMIGVP